MKIEPEFKNKYVIIVSCMHGDVTPIQTRSTFVKTKRISFVTLTCKCRIRENEYGVSGGVLARANRKLRESKIPT